VGWADDRLLKGERAVAEGNLKKGLRRFEEAFYNSFTSDDQTDLLERVHTGVQQIAARDARLRANALEIAERAELRMPELRMQPQE
jgi:hypothetical protein